MCMYMYYVEGMYTDFMNYRLLFLVDNSMIPYEFSDTFTIILPSFLLPYLPTLLSFP